MSATEHSIVTIDNTECLGAQDNSCAKKLTQCLLTDNLSSPHVGWVFVLLQVHSCYY